MFTRRDTPTVTTAIVLFLTVACSYCATSAGVALPDTPKTPDIEPDRGHVSQETALADAYLAGNGVARDPKHAAYLYEKAAGLGDPVAQNQIGYLYQVGLGVEKDSVRAIHWYQLAAAGGLMNAKVNLAVAYIWGTGTQKDPATGEKLLLEAAAKGSAVATTYLGDLSYQGIGVPKDEAAGEKWYEKGVKMHNYLAEYRMGMLLSEPGQHRQDPKRAISLFRHSAEAGFVPAMHSLGRLLVNHPELCSSHQEALTLLQDAAAAGTWQSSLILGALARDGKWVPQDDRQAYIHFRAGALQGGDAAKGLVTNDLQLLSAKISPEDRAQLDEQAATWANEHSQLLSRVYKDHKTGGAAGSLALTTPAPGNHAGTLLPMTAF